MSLTHRLHQISLFSTSAATLSWDQETNLPPAAADYRAAQLSALSAHAHQLATSPEFLADLETAENQNDNTKPSHTANLRELRRNHTRNSKIPTELIARQSTAQSAAHHAWIHARKNSDFSHFAPHLQTLLNLALEKADLWGYQTEPYDALLEDYEPHTSTASIITLLDNLQTSLTPLSAAAVEKTKTINPKLPPGPYPVAAQKAFNQTIAEATGFDFNAGRIDTTTHPFCTTLGPRDTRLTTRYDETDLTSSLFGVLHEAGHGLYEQGLPNADFGLPSGTAVSLGIHESQSRLWENHVGRSLTFWQKHYPTAQQHFPQLANFPLEKFLQHIHRANYSPIRVEADEATYDLHIILRFNIERLLLNRQISIDQVPSTWNDLFQKLFGFTPKNDTHGCLQDIHWSMGGIGYFPTYTLGNINAAQLFHTANQNPDIATATQNADYAPLLQWLQKNIHQHGSTLTPTQLIQNATATPPTTTPYLNHLKSRYL